MRKSTAAKHESTAEHEAQLNAVESESDENWLCAIDEQYMQSQYNNASQTWVIDNPIDVTDDVFEVAAGSYIADIDW